MQYDGNGSRLAKCLAAGKVLGVANASETLAQLGSLAAGAWGRSVKNDLHSIHEKESGGWSVTLSRASLPSVC